MSIKNEITRLQNAKASIKTAIENKGVTVSDDVKLDGYATLINSITTGSGEEHVNPDFYNLRTNNGTDYSNLFNSYSGNNLDLSKWNTSQVTNMRQMFYLCNELISLDVSHFDTSQITNMEHMFYNCTKLTTLDLSSFNTSKVTTMSSMFNRCDALTSLDLSNFVTYNVTNMSNMFYMCSKLVTLDLSNWNTENVTNINSMFYYDDNIVHIFGELDLSNLTNGFYNASYYDPLYNCTKIETLYLKNIYKKCEMTNSSKWSINLGNIAVKDECLTYIIDQLPDLINDKKLTTTKNIILTLPKTNTLTEEQVKVATDKGWQVANTTYNLTSYNVTYNLENVTCTEKLIAKEGMPFKLSLFAEDNYYITSVTVTMGDKTINPTYNIDNYGFVTFANISITSVTGNINIVAKTAEIKIRYSSFTVGVADQNENNILSIKPLNSYDIKSILINGKSQTVPNIDAQIYTVEDGDEIKIGGKFKLIDSNITSISNFELQSCVTSMKEVFYDCRRLTSISFIDKFNTEKINDMGAMFYRCEKLTSLDLSNFDTSNVTDMHAMFQNCGSLISLNLSNFDTLNVTNMDYMFGFCSSLTSLDLSSFNTQNVTQYGRMLVNVPSICTIYINPDLFINKKTGTTFTPSELGWDGTFTPKINDENNTEA